ncbi:MAG: hypothetical protein V2A79_13440 [Planctomycetota bacterium]
MKPRLFRHGLPAAGGAVFLLALVLPTVALSARCIRDGEPPTGGFAISARQWALLGKTVGLAALGTAAALVVSIPAAYVVGRLGRLSSRPVLSALLVAPLLFPPMVYVFGWQRLLPNSFPAGIQCIGVWALWAYPIPALLIGTGGSRFGRGAYEAALLEASPAAAFRHAVLPLLRPHISAAAAILFLILVGEYSVPHACSVLVYATELLGWSEESPRAIDTLWRTLPLSAVLLAALAAAWWSWRRSVAAEDSVEGSPVRGTSGVLTLLAAACFTCATLVPLASLGIKLTSLHAMQEAIGTYSRELLESLVVTGSSGALVVGMGVGVAAVRPLRRAILLWTVVFGVMPGALVGVAIVSAYQTFPMVYDHWPIVVLGYVARFGWIGVLVMATARRAAPEELVWQARIDGADETSVIVRVQAALSWPTLLFGAALAAALALSELPTSTLVRVPSLGLIAHILIEKFHRFEDDMLISLSLWLVLAAVPAAVLLVTVLRRQSWVRA